MKKCFEQEKEELDWPDGIRDTMKNISENSFHLSEEEIVHVLATKSFLKNFQNFLSIITIKKYSVLEKVKKYHKNRYNYCHQVMPGTILIDLNESR